MMDYLFADSYIVAVILPEGLLKIGKGAFSGCSRLQSINISSNVTHIGENAFYECDDLIYIEIPGNVTHIGSGAFSYCQSLQNIVLPDSVKYIGESAFYYCRNIQTIVIPYGVATIENYTFQYCFKLSTVVIPDSVTEIGDYAFSACDYLHNVFIPDRVKSIGEGAFESTSLGSVIIPESVEIGNYAFTDCSLLSTVIIHSSNPPMVGEDVFADIGEKAVVLVPKGRASAYKNADDDDKSDNLWNGLIIEDGTGDKINVIGVQLPIMKYVPYGTVKTDIGLPDKAEVILNDGSIATAGVVWEDGMTGI